MNRTNRPALEYSYIERLDAVLDQAVADHQHHRTADLSPLDAYIRDLAVARSDAIRMRDHTHQWNDEGYCDICGRVASD